MIIPKFTHIKLPVRECEDLPQNKGKISIFSVLRGSTVVAVFAGVFAGLLRESVSLWIPSYMNGALHINKDLSVIITAFVPCFYTKFFIHTIDKNMKVWYNFFYN